MGIESVLFEKKVDDQLYVTLDSSLYTIAEFSKTIRVLREENLRLNKVIARLETTIEMLQEADDSDA
jgi:hypothetical protein